MSFWPYLAIGGASLLNNMGQGVDQTLAQTPGDARLQNLLYPMMQQGAASGMMGMPLYPTSPWIAPPDAVQAPYSTPSDYLGAYQDTSMDAMEKFWGSGGGGSARGGWSGSGVDMGAQVGTWAGRNAMQDYMSSRLPYDQAQNTMLGLGYQNLGQRQASLDQSFAAPWNMMGMYSGSTGNQVVQPTQNPFTSALSTGLGLYGMNQLFGGGSGFFGNAPGAGASTGLNTFSSGAGQGLGSYTSGMEGIGVGSGVGVGTGYGTGVMTGLNTYSSGLGQGLGSYASGMGGVSSGAGTGVGAMGPGMAGGIIGAGIMAAPILGPPVTKWARTNAPFGFEKTAPAAQEWLNAYLSGTPTGTSMGYGQTMPGQDWWGKTSNVQSLLSNLEPGYTPSPQLIQDVMGGKYTDVNSIVRALKRSGTFNDPLAH